MRRAYFSYLEVKNNSSQVEHEASTSKIGEDQLFYCRQRGISPEDAVTLIVNGFCKQVFRELPMEFAVEAQKLPCVSLEGRSAKIYNDPRHRRESQSEYPRRCTAQRGASILLLQRS